MKRPSFSVVPPRHGEEQKAPVDERCVDEVVERLSIDGREVDERVGESQIELPLADGLCALAEDGAQRAGPALDRVELAVVDEGDAGTRRRHRIRRRDRACQRGPERRQPEVGETRAEKNV